MKYQVQKLGMYWKGFKMNVRQMVQKCSRCTPLLSFRITIHNSWNACKRQCRIFFCVILSRELEAKNAGVWSARCRWCLVFVAAQPPTIAHAALKRPAAADSARPFCAHNQVTRSFETSGHCGYRLGAVPGSRRGGALLCYTVMVSEKSCPVAVGRGWASTAVRHLVPPAR